MQDEVFATYTNIIEGQYDDSEYYVVNATPVERPTLQFSKTTLIADGVDELVVINLPIPFQISIDDVIYEITDGEFRFSTETAGVYYIKAMTFPYREGELTVEAI